MRRTASADQKNLKLYHAHVGRIASTWAFIQLHLDNLIWKLAEINPGLGGAITSQPTTDYARIRIIISLLRLRDGTDDFIKRMNQFQLSPTIEKRNRIVHDPWVANKEDGRIAQISIAIDKGKFQLITKERSFKELDDIHTEILKKGEELNSIVSEITSWLESSPQKWREPLGEIHFRHTNPEDQPNDT